MCEGDGRGDAYERPPEGNVGGEETVIYVDCAGGYTNVYIYIIFFPCKGES